MRYPEVYFPNSWPLVVDQMEREELPPEGLDELLAGGWRHFGPEFFRASVTEDALGLKRQIALRIEVKEFKRSRSQRRVWNRNRDLEVLLVPACPGEEEEDLFLRHRQRFERNIPESLAIFLGPEPDGKPCPCLQISVREQGELVAASYLSLGKNSCSTIYGIFDPRRGHRSLGIYTMLLELDYARQAGLSYYYSGYVTIESGCYDYKKSFSALSYFAWDGQWRAMETMI